MAMSQIITGHLPVTLNSQGDDVCQRGDDIVYGESARDGYLRVSPTSPVPGESNPATSLDNVNGTTDLLRHVLQHRLRRSRSTTAPATRISPAWRSATSWSTTPTTATCPIRPTRTTTSTTRSAWRTTSGARSSSPRAPACRPTASRPSTSRRTRPSATPPRRGPTADRSPVRSMPGTWTSSTKWFATTARRPRPTTTSGPTLRGTRASATSVSRSACAGRAAGST